MNRQKSPVGIRPGWAFTYVVYFDQLALYNGHVFRWWMPFQSASYEPLLSYYRLKTLYRNEGAAVKTKQSVYMRKRELQEVDKACRSTNEDVAKVHSDMAVAYDVVANIIESDGPALAAI